ncbi:SRPBCC family protein [Streptomyces sp. VRA16 Mangrove soil]|uniref:SRPBCC family protein n=1 Tax=Streptomyces sp. VRA16 Mangrove soil TaxID=2817434 RepID=UPI001A9D1C9A|nr:SRPBCC family protein [Streptomyces sp. VRA16 Mangrove soil]MBO1330029.1 SRPBCC family protein [Streptomyces sp. VRA16 Mangrove soil]
MRLADRPQVECTIDIDAAVDRVWELVSDISTSARHSPELQEVEWLDGAEGPAVGACFAGRNHNSHLGEWRTVSRIEAVEEGRLFQWAVVYEDDRQGDALAVWTYRVEPAVDGTATRVRHGVRLGTGKGPLHAFVEKYPEREEEIVAGRLGLLRTGIETTLAGVKADAES